MKLRITAYLIMLGLTAFTCYQVKQNLKINITWGEIQSTEQQLANHAVPLPEFQIESEKRAEYAQFFARLEDEIDAQEGK